MIIYSNPQPLFSYIQPGIIYNSFHQLKLKACTFRSMLSVIIFCIYCKFEDNKNVVEIAIV